MAWAPRSIALRPRFARPYPRRVEGVLFDGRVLPCFGAWRGLPPDLRVALAAQAGPLRHRGPGDFVIELLPAGGRRLAVARIDGATTLAAAHAHIAREMARAGSLWRRLRGRDVLGAKDLLKVPELEARGEAPGRVVEIDLRGGGDVHEGDERVSLGRGEMYERYFVADGPFFLWASEPGGRDPALVAWLPKPFSD